MILIASAFCPAGDERDRAHCLRNALLDCGGSGFGSDDVAVGEQGKPFIPDELAPHFSVTHSHGFACAASTVGDITLATDHMEHIACGGTYVLPDGSLFLKLYRSGNLGIDAELIDGGMTTERIDRMTMRRFTAGEREYIFTNSCESAVRDRFYRVWTMKESYGKYTGGGLADGFKFDTSVTRKGFVTAYFTGGGNTYLLTVYAPHPDAERCFPIE